MHLIQKNNTLTSMLDKKGQTYILTLLEAPLLFFTFEMRRSKKNANKIDFVYLCTCEQYFNNYLKHELLYYDNPCHLDCPDNYSQNSFC